MCFGPLRKLCHWGPLTALSIIKVVSFTTIQCNTQWWPPGSSIAAVINATAFLIFSALTLYNFLTALYIGPGYLPYGWKPADDSQCQYLQKCKVCQGYKAPRSHHCRKCQRCVMKMDHHCPWINNCVGHHNHSNFTLFLFFAVCGCFQSTIILSCSIYRALYRNWYLYYGDGTEPIIILGFYSFIITVFALGLAIGVVIAVGMLLYFQLSAIVKNRTAIEDWILSKAKYRRQVAESQGKPLEPFVYPYDLGTFKNIMQVLNKSMTPVGDGIWWHVVPGCDQFTLTMEQKAQKIEKEQRSRPYTIIRDYNGQILPLQYGIRVMCSPPCTDDPRIPLKVNDLVIVTRYSKRWLFGEKRSQESQDHQNECTSSVRGWFPRCCAIPVETQQEEKVDLAAKKDD